MGYRGRVDVSTPLKISTIVDVMIFLSHMHVSTPLKISTIVDNKQKAIDDQGFDPIKNFYYCR